jgi:hypothetical protein
MIKSILIIILIIMIYFQEYNIYANTQNFINERISLLKISI